MMYMPTSPDASFAQKLQDGGRMPEVVITLGRKRYQRDLSGCSSVLGHARYSFNGIDIAALRRIALDANRK